MEYYKSYPDKKQNLCNKVYRKLFAGISHFSPSVLRCDRSFQNRSKYSHDHIQRNYPWPKETSAANQCEHLSYTLQLRIPALSAAKLPYWTILHDMHTSFPNAMTTPRLTGLKKVPANNGAHQHEGYVLVSPVLHVGLC